MAEQESSEFSVVSSDDEKEEKSRQITISYDALWKIYTSLIAKLNMKDYKPSLWGAVLGGAVGYNYGHGIMTDAIKKCFSEYINKELTRFYMAQRLTIPIAYAVQGLFMGATFAISIPAATVYYGGKWIFQ